MAVLAEFKGNVAAAIRNYPIGVSSVLRSESVFRSPQTVDGTCNRIFERLPLRFWPAFPGSNLNEVLAA
jgi:hypothetical protein